MIIELLIIIELFVYMSIVIFPENNLFILRYF